MAVRDCCGRITGYLERAPKPGEGTFVQCRCAEKRTAHDYGLPPRLQPFFVPAVQLDLPALIAEPRRVLPGREELASVPIPPSIRPPDRA
ncbi:hypothetical protein EON79_07520 [bacterium]|nr:MAG: hypothetical protein EON79_07520 [bacterium]